MKQNILITGCAGFIGSHAVDDFLNKGYRVTGVDCFTYAAKESNISHNYDNKNFNMHTTDICDTEEIFKICNENSINSIINFAAETHVDNLIDSCDAFINSNITGVKSLLDVCRRTGIFLLHVSTDEVYGSTLDGSFDEKSKLNPQNPYSATKAAAEHLVRSYSNTYGVKYNMVRPSNNFGPRQHSEKFIPTILRSIGENKKIPIYGNGENIRDWLYVKENVRAIRYIFENATRNETFNITAKTEMKNIDLVKKILEKRELSFSDCVSFVEDRKGHDFRYSITNDKLTNLGFKFNNDMFEEYLVETIRSREEDF